MRVAVLGVGLIGGSIGLAARARAEAEVCGYDPDPDVGARALELGAVGRVAEDLATAVRGADVVFVAAPVGALPATVAAALDAAGPDCVISDVGSTKRLLAQASADPRFVGGHPLAGAESEGVEHAREDLFDGATWYLTPTRESTAGVLYERLHALLRRFGAHPTAIDAATHDRLMANISHLPHVLANLLAAQAAGLLHNAGEQGERLPAVGPSFRDAIRVAGANSAIWTDIYTANGDALLAAIDELSDRLGDVRAMLAAGDGTALSAWIERARVERDALLGTGLSGGSVHELRVHVPNRPGVIAEIALALGEAGVNIGDLALAPSRDNSQGVVALWVDGETQAERAQELVTGLGFPVVRA
ncbi:MAG: Prephenate dehydrogenase [Solirubrobacterales bacterium]|jgi:prephenate dehydrogenase|nr:Prephenate dehydrogenase [Solirubrobacterales bacterium]